MKKFLSTKAIPVLLGVALIFSCAFSISQKISKNKLERELLSVHNELAEAIGTIEVSEGVYSRLASQNENLNRQYQDLLGENEMLSETLEKSQEEIRTLIQTTATLREQIQFNGNATTTVVAGCNDRPNNSTSNQTTTVSSDPVEEDEFVPNLRVEFNLEKDGFRIVGFTESNPRLMLGPPTGSAEVTLSQIEPFIIDITITENNDNDWRAIIYEQQRRLQFDVGVLSVNPRTSRIRWYERIGLGSQIVATDRGFGIAPTFSARIGSRGSWSFTGGPYWSFDQGTLGRGVTAGFSVYPFSRRRN